MSSPPHTGAASLRPPRYAHILLLALPWLVPFSGGPSASVEPWLASAACAIVLAAISPLRMPAGVAIGVAVSAVLSLPRAGVLEGAALAGALVLVALAAMLACASSDEAADAIATAWCVAALASTVIALVQYFGWSDHFAPWVSHADAGTAYANLRQRNQFASLTAIGLAALLWHARGGGRLGVLVASAIVLGVGNAASVSRTGLVELLALLGLALAWPGRSRRQALVAGSALAAYALAAFVLPRLLTWVTGINGMDLWQRVSNVGACSSRSVLWSNVLHLIAQRPWLGWGWGELDYAHYVTLYPGARFCDILDNAHNLPLHVAVELGVPVALLLLLACAWAFWRARPWAEADSTRQLAWGVLGILALHSMLEYPLWYGPFQMALGLALGLLCRGARTSPVGWSVTGSPRWILLAAVAAALVYATADYKRVSQVYLPPDARWSSYREDPLAKLRGNWLFRSHADFAELTLAPLTAANAEWTLERAEALLHYSPEPRVIQKIVESALLLHRDDIVAFHLPRWEAAFPESYAEWLASRADVKRD